MMHSAEFYRAVQALRLLDDFHKSLAHHAAQFWTEEKLMHEIAQADMRTDEPPAMGVRH
jgi:hypothetical protein